MYLSVRTTLECYNAKYHTSRNRQTEMYSENRGQHLTRPQADEDEPDNCPARPLPHPWPRPFLAFLNPPPPPPWPPPCSVQSPYALEPRRERAEASPIPHGRGDLIRTLLYLDTLPVARCLCPVCTCPGPCLRFRPSLGSQTQRFCDERLTFPSGWGVGLSLIHISEPTRR